MANCIVVVQFDLPKRTEEQAVKGGTSTAPIYRGLAKQHADNGQQDCSYSCSWFHYGRPF